METLAKQLLEKINQICVQYYYFRKTNIVELGKNLAGDIQQFAGGFLQGNIYGMEENEYTELQNYVVGVLKDYTEAIEQNDMVLMADTLDNGLRELLNVFVDIDDGENSNE